MNSKSVGRGFDSLRAHQSFYYFTITYTLPVTLRLANARSTPMAPVWTREVGSASNVDRAGRFCAKQCAAAGESLVFFPTKAKKNTFCSTKKTAYGLPGNVFDRIRVPGILGKGKVLDTGDARAGNCGIGTVSVGVTTSSSHDVSARSKHICSATVSAQVRGFPAPSIASIAVISSSGSLM
jgi:hypothetical protein